MTKKIFILSFIFIYSSFTVPKKKKFIPPGTVQITETLFADETEIDNWAWAEYEYWTKIKYGYHSPEHIGVLPDTLIWNHKLSYSEPYVEYYYRHPAYRNYPVVGISYEQVQAYCKWRPERVRENYAIENKQDLKIEYRLPTKEEWEWLSNNGTDIFYTQNGKNKKGIAILNCKRAVTDSVYTPKGNVGDAGDVTAPVKSYQKNRFGLYNFIGNVAEMIAEKGISKGGSWKQFMEECRPGIDTPYQKPEAWLGFRCVCIVKS
jgi:formylglycine-generating enzyme required for sulfatase activity